MFEGISALLGPVVRHPATSLVLLGSGLAAKLLGPDGDQFKFASAVWIGIGATATVIHLVVMTGEAAQRWRHRRVQARRIADASKPREQLIASLSRAEIEWLNLFFSRADNPPSRTCDQHDPMIVQLERAGFLHKVPLADASSLDAIYYLRAWVCEQKYKRLIADRVRTELGHPLGAVSVGGARSPADITR